MATFKQHLESSTGLSFQSGSANRPNLQDLNIYLREGIKDVIQNVLRFSPASAELFAVESLRKQNSDNFKVKSGAILEVIRERVTNEWRPCRPIPVSKQYLVTDIDSFDYASSYNPVYMRDSDNIIKVFPDYTSLESSLGFKVRHVDFTKYDSEDFDLTYNTDLESPGIKGYPSMFIPHLVQYGAVKALTEYYHYSLKNDEDLELAAGYLQTLKEMKSSYDSMFLTKDILTQSKKQSQEQPRQRRG